MTRPVLAAVLLVAGAAPVAAQPAADGAALRGESPPTRKRLAEAEAKLTAGKPQDAADDLQRLLDEAGDDLVSLDGRQFRPARWVAHQLLARLPADVLKGYQARVDEPARRLLDAGRRGRDPRPLWQLLDRYFVSKPAADGLLLLGDLLFDRGEYRTGELLWRRLLPDGGADLSHPSPPADLAAVRARVVLAAVFTGEPDRAAAELKAFAEKHPGAAGPIAGKTGPYADTLQALLDRPPRPPADPAGAADWPTFAGDPSRTGRVNGPIPRHWRAAPTWTAPIPGATRERSGVPAAPGRPPFGHPVIAGGKVYLADAGRVHAFDLRTGSYTLLRKPDPQFGDRSAAGPDPCATLTWADGRMYARTGPAAVRPPDQARPGRPAEDSALVRYDPQADPLAPPKPAWRVLPPQPEGKKTAAWEGAPLVAGGRLWAALARWEDGRVVHSVAAFDPADPDPDTADRPAWVAEACDAPAGADPRPRQELLTLAGRNVVLNSNSGAVVAVDAVTGRRAWAFLYPKPAKPAAPPKPDPLRPDPFRAEPPPRPADPGPAVAFGGRVFVAPADADRVFALDAETGKLLWESERAEGAAILGVARGRVIVTTTGQFRGIRALSVVNGSCRRPDGWIQGGTGSDWLSYGRGFVSDRVIAWPTRSRHGLYFLDPETGNPIPTAPPAVGPRNGLWGNVVYADGVLVVVTPNEVWGFVAEGKPPADPPEEPRRAIIAALDRAEEELADGDWAAARATLREVIRGDGPAPWRAWAAGRLLDLSSPAAVREVVTPDLRDEWLVTATGELTTLGALVEPPAVAPKPPPEPIVRLPEPAPDLAPHAGVRHTLPLPPAARPLQLIPGASAAQRHLFVAAPGAVLAVVVALDDRSVTTFPAADLFTHAADLPCGFVAAGPSAVAVYPAPGEVPWVFRVPETDPLPKAAGGAPLRTAGPPAPLLSSFALAGAWLVARLGDHHLLALDLPGRRVAWVLRGDGGAGYRPVLLGPVPRFSPELFATDRLVVVQLSDGRRWTLDRDTGRPCGDGGPTAKVAWAAPPAAVGPWLAVSDGAGLVRLMNPATERAKWSADAGGESSLTGDPPGVRSWGDTLITAVRRDYGVELDRLDPRDGGSLWAGDPAFLDADRLDLRHADADRHHLYIPVGNRLVALRLGDSKPAWSAALPDARGAAGWAVRAAGGAVAVYPLEAVPAEPVAVAGGRAARSWLRFPAGWRLPALAAAVYDTWADRTAPVLLLDPDTGEVGAELAVPARGPGVVARPTADALVVATADRVAWVR